MDCNGKDYDRMDKIFIRDLRFRCIIGIDPEERVNKQDVIINLELYSDFSRAVESEDINETVNYKELKLAVMEFVENSSYLLVEKLCQAVADLCLEKNGVEAVKVSVEKPDALRFCKSVGVEIFRRKKG